MKFHRLIYLPFGNNFIIGPSIKRQLNFLKDILPEEFKGKELYDLGCGDGKITLKFKEIFYPTKVYGCDDDPELVWRAKRRGIKAVVMDLNKEVPKGELAVFWGVLHHLKNQKAILEKIKENFKYLFLREPLLVKGKKSFMEIGKPFLKKEIYSLIDNIFEDFKKYEYENSIFIFWEKNK